MAYVTINILESRLPKRGRELAPWVIPMTKYGPTAEGVYKGLEEFHQQWGQLTDNTGRSIGRAGWDLLQAGEYTFTLSGKPADSTEGRWPLENLLRDPLPRPSCIGTVKPTAVNCSPLNTHPTVVKEWPTWETELQKKLSDALRPHWWKVSYEQTGNTVTSDDTAAALLLATVCQRINTLFETTNHPFDSSVDAHPHARQSKDRIHKETGFQVEAEEELQGNFPDICLMELTGIIREIHHTTLCNTGLDLLNTNNDSLPAIWNKVCNGEPVEDQDAANHVVDAIARELGFMSRRGHKTGTICTYFKTWLLKTDGKGCVEISDPIPFDSQGTDTKASMTEAFLFSAISNRWDLYKKPYSAARHPGEPPISMLDFITARKTAQADLALRQEGKQVRSSCTLRCPRLRSGTKDQSAELPLSALRLTTRLAPFMFLGSVNGTVAAVRLATYHADGKRAEHEAQVYERLKHLQGDCVPRLLEHGHILKEPDAYFVAMEFIEGTAWESYSDSYDTLFQKLESAVNKIHAAGVVHNNLYDAKILVTPDDRVIVHDFTLAMMDPTPEDLKAEKDCICSI